MTAIQTTLHIINLGLFLAAIVGYSSIWRKVLALTDSDPIGTRRTDVITSIRAFKVVATCICGFGAGLSFMFIVLQMDWVMSHHNVAVGDATSWAWLVFDYLLAMFNLSLIAMGNVLLEWRGGLPSTWNHDKGLDDEQRYAAR